MKKKEILGWIIMVIIAVVAALAINLFIIINCQVPTGSMEPTVYSKSRVIGLRFSYYFSEPERGDVIVFEYPDDPSKLFLKRIVGLPGDVIEIKEGVTYINDEVYEEEYLAETPYPLDYGPYVVPDGYYFVMGDNRNNSNDSRYWNNTYVSRKAVKGKAVLCYWPLNRFGVVE